MKFDPDAPASEMTKRELLFNNVLKGLLAGNFATNLGPVGPDNINRMKSIAVDELIDAAILITNRSFAQVNRHAPKTPLTPINGGANPKGDQPA